MFIRYLVIQLDVYTLNGYTPAFKFICCGTSNFFIKLEVPGSCVYRRRVERRFLWDFL